MRKHGLLRLTGPMRAQAALIWMYLSAGKSILEIYMSGVACIIRNVCVSARPAGLSDTRALLCTSEQFDAFGACRKCDTIFVVDNRH